ncbi:hybrid sensor histidine kinase/response regulator [Geminocystis sp. NIES-3709]|uniref:hybrid sensor histidine kinase/response regulator n=1 Tax=Geminocystis sp. NIES-3709 TaxID=1617448 RepID=UPI0005FCD03C|nr:hybrid sensor histidine kinase/response regulator [Geminocystis sp. NIES-3709]BAQ64949.1 signal transduction histidine kinase CheA [Geminocystis sp. NIES-3709]
MITSEQASQNQKLYKQTLIRLGEMLKILKEGDNSRNREHIKSHCDFLSIQGKKLNLFGWVEVMETSKMAILNPENDYDSTTKLIIKEIKKAGEYLVKNEINSIFVGDSLQVLAPNARSRLMDLETVYIDAAEIKMAQEEAYNPTPTLQKDLWRETNIDFNPPIPEPVQLENNDSIPDDEEDSDIFFADLGLSDDDSLLDDWLDDDSFADENQHISAVFVGEEDFNIPVQNSDDDDLSNLFDDNDNEHQSIDQWTDDKEISHHENSDDWEFLLDEDQDESVIISAHSEIDEVSDDLEDLFDDNPSQEKYKVTIIQENFDGDDLDDLFTQSVRSTVIIDDPQAELEGILNNLDDLEIEDDFPSTGTFNTYQILQPVKRKQPHVLVYDDFEDLNTLLTNNFQWIESQDIFSDLESIIFNSVINYYDDQADLEKLVNSSRRNVEEVNWQELSNIVEDLPTKEFSSNKKTTKNQDTLSGLSDLDQLLAQAGQVSGKQKQKWTRPQNNLPAKTQPKIFEQSMRVSVKQLDNLNNLIGEMVVRRNRLEEDQDKLRQFLENLLSHVQNLSDVGARMQDTYERSLLEGALIDSRKKNEATVKAQLARAESRSQSGVGRSESTYFGNSDNGGTTENNKFQPPELDELELDRFTGFHLLAQDILELIVRVRESTSDIQFLVDETDQLGRNLRQVTTQLQEEINKSRMVSFSQNADRLPLPIRKIAEGYNKQIKLKVEGREVLIDKMILEHLWDPLLQITKNCVTHGIELPEERESIGKPPMGTITVRAFLQGPQTVISVSDDGAGIDPQKIKKKAIQNKLITPAQAQNLKDQDIYEFLFHAGFTTKEKADSHAGRGVGLDIVRTKLNEIRGSVTVDSTPGMGTTFTIRLPLTLSIGKALCCMNDNTRIAFPIDGIEDTKDYSASEIKVNAQGQKCILWKNTLLPFRPLSTLMNYNRQITRSIIYTSNAQDETIPIVILRGGNNLLAIQVDQVLGQEEIVIKQISGPLPKPKGIAGATVRSDGIVMAIGDVIELIEIAQGNLSTKVHVDMPEGFQYDRTVFAEPVKTQPLILIVDDSITVREMLSMSLSKAGYRFEQARDGQEAWQKLRSGLPCDIVFCDIEMPRMNGLELLQHIQEDPELNHIPVAILSSRGAEKHQRIAAELGASAYLIKPYVDSDLLESTKKMLEGEVLLTGSTKQPKLKANKSTLPPQQQSTSTGKKKTKSSPMVLIIDDSVVVREMLSMTFKKAGYQVEQARDGQDAWDKVVDGLPCDLLLCDIEMPRMNGLELLAKMQQDENLSKLPVAMVTSRGAEKHRKIAADLGAKAYFTKPYLEEELLNAAQKLIKGEVLL